MPQLEYAIVSSHLLNLNWVHTNTMEKTAYSRALREVLGDIISKHHFDVLHAHDLHFPFAPEAAHALDELRGRLGFRMHHTFHETWPYMVQDDPMYRSWDGNYAVSAFVQLQCEERLGFRPRLFHLGIDLESFRCTRSAFSTGTTPIILHPARLLPWKGVHLSVRMLAEVRKQGLEAKLVLTDSPRITHWKERDAYREEILALISTLDLRDHVELRSVAYSEMPALYDEADIVVYPTLGEEPYGLVPLEAMSCERPIVGARSGGMTETVLHGETGYVVERGDVDSLTAYVSRLLANPALAQRLGAAGRQHVHQHFDIRRYISTLIGYYKG
jgi:glycosyltransferase involved in cell wall biosynthesis